MKHASLLLLPLLLAAASLADGGAAVVGVSDPAWSHDTTLDGSLRVSADERLTRYPLVGVAPDAAVVRGWIALGFGTAEAGVTAGPACGIGFGDGRNGFFALAPDGAVAWTDSACPIEPYQAYGLELVREGPRYRVQLLTGDGASVLSQSPWLPRDGAPAATAALFARGGVARFGGWRAAAQPASELLDFPPNLARLGGEGSGWRVTGGGNWHWTDATRSTVAQARAVDRSFALCRQRPMGPGTTRARIRIHPGAGGAGIVTQTSENLTGGFTCWLGGQFGAGCLMLYEHEPVGPRELWAGKPDQWHYDEDLVVEIATRSGEARVRLYQADGATLLDESPWVATEQARSEAEGYLALQTWLGTAEFSAFPGAGEAGGPAVTTPTASTLGPGWAELGGVTAAWTATAGESPVALTAGAAPGAALVPRISGIAGTWRATITPGEGSAAGLAIQASAALDQGLLLTLDTEGRVTLTEIGVATPIWSTEAPVRAGVAHTVELVRLTDVVSVRVVDADGAVLAQRDRCYIPARFNALEGRLGLTVDRGSASFSGWKLD